MEGDDKSVSYYYRSVVESAKMLLFQMDDVDISEEGGEKGSGDDFMRGGDGDEGGRRAPDPSEVSGKKSDYWYDSLEERSKENARRSRENKMVLTRLDLRTTWIMRILIGMIVTAGGTYFIDLVLI